MNPETLSTWTKYLTELHRQNGGITEVRILSWQNGTTRSDSRCFSDGVELVKTLQEIEKKVEARGIIANYYTTLNPTTVSSGKPSSDRDISAYLWLPIDIDPIRFERNELGEQQALLDQKVPTTDEELGNAKKAADIIEALVEAETGVACTVAATSGNGEHRLWRIEGAAQENKPLVRGILAKLHDLFILDGNYRKLFVDVDSGNYNDSRIWKLYGTVGKKSGGEYPGRSFRPATIEALRDDRRVLTTDDLKKLLEKLSSLVPARQLQQPTVPLEPVDRQAPMSQEGWDWTKAFAGYDLMTLDVEKALRDSGYAVHERFTPAGDNRERIAITCPNSDGKYSLPEFPGGHGQTNGHKDTVVFLPRLTESGKRSLAGIWCSHDHCEHLRGEAGAKFLHTVMLTPEAIRNNCSVDENFSGKDEFEPGPDVSELDLGERPKKREVTEIEAPKPFSLKTLARDEEFMISEVREKKREVLIPGFLLAGSTIQLAAPTKVGKTFQLMHMTVAMINQLEFWGMRSIRPLRVLFIDPELMLDMAQERYAWIRSTLMKNKPENAKMLTYVSLRGQKILTADDPWGILMDGIQNDLLSGEDWDVIIVDSMYCFQGKTNLNDSSDVGRMLNQLLAMVTCKDKEPAVIYVHHFAKGDPGMKKSLDRGAGSFAWSARVENIVTMTPHPLSQDTGIDHYNLEFTLRYFPKKEDIVVKRMAYPNAPIFEVANGVAPKVDSVYLQRRVLALKLTACLDMLIKKRILPDQNYFDVFIPAKEAREAAQRFLNVSDRKDFDAIKQIAQDERWISHSGAGAGITYQPTPDGKCAIEDIKDETHGIYGTEKKEEQQPSNGPEDFDPISYKTVGG